ARTPKAERRTPFRLSPSTCLSPSNAIPFTRQVLRKETAVASSAGLRDVVAGTSSICTVDGQQGKLAFRGIDIQELAEHASFEEVVYLLWYERLPKRAELDALQAELHAAASLPAPAADLLRRFPPTARPMDALRTAVSALSMWDPDNGDNSREANLRKSVRLTAQIPILVTSFNHLRNGREPVAPRPDLSYAANFLYMLNGEPPTDVAART